MKLDRLMIDVMTASSKGGKINFHLAALATRRGGDLDPRFKAGGHTQGLICSLSFHMDWLEIAKIRMNKADGTLLSM